MNYWLLFIPLLSALTGWITIRLCIWLLFHPREAKTVAGITLQGQFPRHQSVIAGRAATFVAAELSSLVQNGQGMDDPRNFGKVKPLIEAHMDDFLRNKLKEQMPMIGMFIGDKTILTLKTIFIQEIETLFPRVMKEFAGHANTQSAIAEMVRKKLVEMPPGKIEELAYQQLGGQFRTFCLLGGIVGFVMGMLQLILIMILK